MLIERIAAEEDKSCGSLDQLEKEKAEKMDKLDKFEKIEKMERFDKNSQYRLISSKVFFFSNKK